MRVGLGSLVVDLRHDAHEGRCSLPAQARVLLRQAVASATVLTEEKPDEAEDEETGERPPLGFTAVVERVESVDPLERPLYEDEE